MGCTNRDTGNSAAGSASRTESICEDPQGPVDRGSRSRAGTRTGSWTLAKADTLDSTGCYHPLSVRVILRCEAKELLVDARPQGARRDE